MQEQIDTDEEFAIVKRARSFAHAGRGVWVFIKTTPHAWVHCGVFASVILLGLFLGITAFEWAALLLAGGFVIVAEAFNTAIEIDIDLTSPEYHPYARDTKDVAAGAVLLAAIFAAAVGSLIFIPYISI